MTTSSPPTAARVITGILCATCLILLMAYAPVPRALSGVASTPMPTITAALPPKPLVDSGHPESGAMWREGPRTSDEYKADVLAALAPDGSGGPDAYGYAWTDTIPYYWISAGIGTDAGVSTSVPASGYIPLGFDFKFYEYTYAGLYVSLHGYASFDNLISSNVGQAQFPAERWPNNLIAPHMAPIYRLDGYVRYLRGGTAPNRFFVVEWNSVVSTYNGDDIYTYEMILYENGTIDFSYQAISMNGGWYCQSSGIEDSSGRTGLATTPNCTAIASYHSLRISRPAPGPHLKFSRPEVGRFAHPGKPITVGLEVRNIGEWGNDVLDLMTISAWTVSLVRADTLMPLTDTDMDGVVDTGSLAAYQAAAIKVVVRAPESAAVGDAATVSIVGRSSLSSSVRTTATLHLAIPTAFAQTYQSDAGTMGLLLEKKDGEREARTSPPGEWGYSSAVAERPDGGFMRVWQDAVWSPAGGRWVSEIKLAWIDSLGEVRIGPKSLTNSAQLALTTTDYRPAVAVAPSGRTAVLWNRTEELVVAGATYFRDNMYAAIVDPWGNLVMGPINVSNFSSWGSWSTIPSVDFSGISSTSDNRFVLSWTSYVPVIGCGQTDCWLTDVYVASINDSGDVLHLPTRVTTDTIGPASEAYSSPSLTRANSTAALLTWSRQSDGAIYRAVVNSSGNVVNAPALLARPWALWLGSYTDAAQLSNGRFLVAGKDGASYIWYTILDANYNQLTELSYLPSLHTTTDGGGISVVADGAGSAAITWLKDSKSRYYSLVDGNGVIKTEPMEIYKDSVASSDTPGFANAPYMANVALNPPFERAFLPLLNPPCDAFEPNDNRGSVIGGAVQSNTSYSAKICKGDAEDNYRFTKSSAGAISLSISLPSSLLGHATFFVYAAGNLGSPLAGCVGAGQTIGTAPYMGTCSGLVPGDYIIRLYTDGPAYYDDIYPYTFQVVY